jgi:hypothetical protein
MDDVKAGVYRHYKGPLYLVMGLAHDANADEFFSHDEEKYFPTGEREVIVYIGLELTDAHTGPRLAIRTARDVGDAFYDLVHTGDGTACKHVGLGSTWCSNVGQEVARRFTYLGPTWEGQH